MKILHFSFLLFIVLSCLSIAAQEYSLPQPPPEFFSLLAESSIPPGKVGCCNKLRKMLTDSVMISPYLAVKLFREGKIILGDARLQRGYNSSHILGALPFPHDKVDFMALKPFKKPIALY